MDIELKWLDAEQTILLHHARSLLNEAELIESPQRVFAMLEGVTNPVYVIAEVNPNVPAPKFAPLRLVETVFRKILAHPQTNMIMVVGGNAFLRSIGSIVVHYLRVRDRVVFCKSREDALRQIQQHRTKSRA
jgi:hypothetical protein